MPINFSSNIKGYKVFIENIKILKLEFHNRVYVAQYSFLKMELIHDLDPYFWRNDI
jgi:hypothetical protein